MAMWKVLDHLNNNEWNLDLVPMASMNNEKYMIMHIKICDIKWDDMTMLILYDHNYMNYYISQ